MFEEDFQFRVAINKYYLFHWWWAETLWDDYSFFCTSIRFRKVAVHKNKTGVPVFIVEDKLNRFNKGWSKG